MFAAKKSLVLLVVLATIVAIVAAEEQLAAGGGQLRAKRGDYYNRAGWDAPPAAPAYSKVIREPSVRCTRLYCYLLFIVFRINFFFD
jgi:hypothetical protein